ncbi:MAG: hypothetical protein Q8Q09_27365 [Deltaproteobacteria bacterium]|nr:hypothetical protein [Deltaproteobacteria bacterium]
MKALTSLRALPLTLVAILAVACGSRSQLRDSYPALPEPPPDVTMVDARPDGPPGVDVRPMLTVSCPAPLRSTQSLSGTITANASSNVSRPITGRWELTRGPMDSRAMLTMMGELTAQMTFDVGGEYRFRYTARDDLGNEASCETRADVESAIDLLCPNDQSNFQGATVSLAARARSRLSRPVTVQWETVMRPAASMTMPTPATSTDARLTLDALGDWQLRLVARDSMGLMASCQTAVHADPDVIVTCPADQTSRPFATAMFAAMARSRTGRPLRFQWEIVDQPITSTARLTNATALTSSFTFDVAGNWSYRFTATNDQGNRAFCTTRALSASDEAVRVEIVWNTDRSNPQCNPDRPAGNSCGDIDLHVNNSELSNGRWADEAPNGSTCYFANCRCGTPGMVCTEPTAVEWAPPGPVNNPQLDVDHTSDLPGPENINIVRAAPGGRFDVGVHVYRTNQATPVVARIYCGGSVIFESEPVRMRQGSSPSENDMWLVGRIETTAGGCTFVRCGSPGNLTACIRPRSEWRR